MLTVIDDGRIGTRTWIGSGNVCAYVSFYVGIEWWLSTLTAAHSIHDKTIIKPIKNDKGYS